MFSNEREEGYHRNVPRGAVANDHSNSDVLTNKLSNCGSYFSGPLSSFMFYLVFEVLGLNPGPHTC